MSELRRIPAYSETYLAIQNYWYDTSGKVHLKKEYADILDRWSFADRLIRMEYVDEADVPTLMKKRFPTISRSTIYEDIRNAKRLFGSVSIEDMMYYSTIHYSYALEGFKKAMAKGQMIAAGRFLELMHKIKGQYADSANDEKQKELAEMMKNSQVIYIVDNPERVNLKSYTSEEIDALRKKLSTPGNISDAQFEELK